MAIEIKGLRSDALLARANIDRVRAAYARFNQAAPAHADDVDKLASDITGMQSDLEFAATVMGNSAGESERLAHGDSKEPVTTPRVALGPHPDQPEVMPDTTEGAIWSKTPTSGPGLGGIVDADKIRAQVNKAAAQDTAEVAEGPVATFRAAE